ncbi:MAG: aminotransferase class IV [Acidobacteriota bacterium]
MHESVFFNSGSRTASEPKISALSSAALYGKGIFTTVAIYDGKPFLWEKHWRRLEENAERLALDLTIFPENQTRSGLDELLLANAVHNGRARITFFDESAGALWRHGSKRPTSLTIMTADLRPRVEEFSLTVSPFRINSTSPLAGVKSCNYLEKILALDEATGRGFDESIQLNERGEIASACMANIFWVKGGKLFTPSLNTRCVAGTTREFVIESVECTETEARLEELSIADDIFLTSAGNGARQVTEFDGRRMKRETHRIMRLLPACG